MKSCCSSYAVIDIGFGDSGKGAQVDRLCSYLNNPLVIRYSGGQQAAHTVMRDKDTYHVFSNFGSGTLRYVPTYWSRYCTFDPVGTINEYEVLSNKLNSPILYIDKKCPVTTPCDIFHNQDSGEYQKNGTCGVGVGATWQREQDKYSLLAGDLLYESVLREKLINIQSYYDFVINEDEFIRCCNRIKNSPNFWLVDCMPGNYDNYIFEGSQGLLLDQDIGFFPYVTRSNVGSKNILEMGIEPYVYLMTRAYQTRHGNGPMTNEELPHNIKQNPYETNKTNKYQGEFRRSLLDLDLLKYGIERDYYIRETRNKELVITCVDLVENEFRYTVEGRIISHVNKEDFARSIGDYLGVGRVSMISSPFG